MTRFLIALVLALFSLPALAQEVKVTADTFVVDEGSETATFTGNVLVTRETLTINANEVVVNYGKGGVQNITQMVATGNVRLKTPDQDATGDRAVYEPKSQILVLSGDVQVVNAAGTMRGPQLQINLATNTTTFSGGGGGGRVTGSFTPQ
jgi:lipopolysaccharide export system protein LptA